MRSGILRIIVVLLIAGVVTTVNSQTPKRERRGATVAAPKLPEGVKTVEVKFFSDGVQCFGKIFKPAGFSAESKAAAVVLAPGFGETAESIERYAAHFASKGVVAMAIDYRGWGKSGGFLQYGDQVKTDDRLRFSQMTAKIRIRRKRINPEAQVLDIRNALFYLQGEPGIDRARLGVWGTDLGGGHAVVVAGSDVRIKAAVAQVPLIEGRDTPKKASSPTGELLQFEHKRARNGNLPVNNLTAGTMNDPETKRALAEYHPFWFVERIPQKIAVLFVVAENDTRVNNETNAIAASKLLKGPTEVVTVQGSTHSQIDSGANFEKSAKAAVDWFLKYL